MISRPELLKHLQYIIQTAYFLDVYPPSQRLLLYPTIKLFEKFVHSSFDKLSVTKIVEYIYTFRDQLCLLLLNYSSLSLPEIVKFFYKFTVPNDSANFIEFLMDNITDIPPTRTQQQIQYVRNSIQRRHMLYSILRRKGHDDGGGGVQSGGGGAAAQGDGGGLVFKTRRSRPTLHQGGGGAAQGGGLDFTTRRSRPTFPQGGKDGSALKQVMSSISKIKEPFNRIQLMEMLGLTLEEATVLVNLAEIHNRLEQIQIQLKKSQKKDKLKQEKLKLQLQKRKYVLPSLTTSSSLSTLLPPPPPPPPPQRPPF